LSFYPTPSCATPAKTAKKEENPLNGYNAHVRRSSHHHHHHSHYDRDWSEKQKANELTKWALLDTRSPAKWKLMKTDRGTGNLVHTTYTQCDYPNPNPNPTSTSTSTFTFTATAVAAFCISVFFLRHFSFLFLFAKTTDDGAAGGGYGKGATLMQILWRKKKKKL